MNEEQAQQASRHDFGFALDKLKSGGRVARAGWNGKGMWLFLIPDDYAADLQHEPSGKLFTGLPWIGIKTADDKFVPWLASQTDVLAEDWDEVQ